VSENTIQLSAVEEARVECMHNEGFSDEDIIEDIMCRTGRGHEEVRQSVIAFIITVVEAPLFF